MRTSEKVFFDNAAGVRLCGIIDSPALPDGEANRQPDTTALFSHCFTCSKDLKAIVKISRQLAELGITVLRFDFTGLGESGGSFSDSTFDDCCADVMAAAEFMSQKIAPPRLLIGHSLGGAAMMAMASSISSTTALVTVASPWTTIHLATYLSETNPAIEATGSGEVEIGGRRWLLKRELIENLRQRDLPTSISSNRFPHLLFHPLEDDTLPYSHARKILELSGGPTSLITLDKSDHLLVTRKEDCPFVAETIASWFARIDAR